MKMSATNFIIAVCSYCHCNVISGISVQLTSRLNWTEIVAWYLQTQNSTLE